MLFDLKDVTTGLLSKETSDKVENKGELTLKSLINISHKSVNETETEKPDKEVKEVIKVNVADDGKKMIISGDIQVTSQTHPEVSEKKLEDEFTETDVTEDNKSKNFPENCDFVDIGFDEIAGIGFSYNLNNAKGADTGEDNELDLGGEFEEDDTASEVKTFVDEEFQASENLQPENVNYLVQEQNAELQAQEAEMLFGDEDEENY